MNDLHIHTKFSCDSDAEMKEYIENAIHKGMNSIGSDAHEVKDLAADNEAAKELSKSLGLQEVIFINRKGLLE